MKNNKKVMLCLDDEIYYKIKKLADKKHIPLSTYIKLCLVNMIEGGNTDGK